MEGETDCIEGKADHMEGEADRMEGETECMEGEAECMEGEANCMEGKAECMEGEEGETCRHTEKTKAETLCICICVDLNLDIAMHLVVYACLPEVCECCDCSVFYTTWLEPLLCSFEVTTTRWCHSDARICNELTDKLHAHTLCDLPSIAVCIED